jgi:hypothetical protein
MNRYAIRLTGDIPARLFHRGHAASLPRLPAKLLDLAEDLLDVTRILAKDPALQYQSIWGYAAVIHLAVTRDPLIGIDSHQDLAVHYTAPARRRRGVSLSSRTRIGRPSPAAATTALTSVLTHDGDAHVGDFQIRRFRIPVDILGIGFQVRKEAKSCSHASRFQKRTPPKQIVLRRLMPCSFLSDSQPRYRHIHVYVSISHTRRRARTQFVANCSKLVKQPP